MKELKQLLIDDLAERLRNAPFLFVVDYTGMTVPQFAEIRRRLSEQESSIRVYKNTYVRRTGETLKFPEELRDALKGQSAVVQGNSEAPGVAKILKNYAAEFNKGVVKGGVLDGRFLDANACKALAALPGKDSLRAQLLGLLNAPATQLLRTMNEPAASLARLLNSYKDKLSA